MPLAVRQIAARPALPAPWIPLAEAAMRLGCSPGHLRRRCAEEWRAQSLARQFEGVWGIHPSADPRLAGIETWRDRDLRQFAALRADGVRPRYIEIAEQRRDLVVGFAAYAGPGRTTVERLDIYLAAAAADGGPKCSRRTFYLWQSAYAQPADDGGVRALVPAYKADDSALSREPIGQAAWEYAAQLLNAGNAIRAATAHTLTRDHVARHGLAGDPAWRLPGLRCFQVICRQRRPKPLRIMCDKGLRAFDAACVPKGQRDYEQIASGECYIGDERTLDILVKIPDDRTTWRPHRGVKLTAWMDERSRYVVGWILAPFANTITILGSFKRAIRDHGIPSRVRTDCGKDYRSATGGEKRWDVDELDAARVRSVIERLGIQHQQATPFFPWAKSIESWFGTLKEHFDKLLASYIGGSPTERHQDRHAWAKKNPHLLPTIEEVEAMLADYIARYHATPHSGHGVYGNTPAEALEKFRAGPVRTLPEDTLEFHFLGFTEPKLVRRDGVRHLKAWYGWGEPRLVALQGEKVILGIHPDDAGTAWVCDLEQRPLFRVACERHRFATRRDAERIARTRATLRAEYSAPARAARGYLIDTPPSQLLGTPVPAATETPPRRQPRLTVVDPALSSAIRAAAEQPFESPVAGSEDECVRLEDMTDPLAADAAAIDEPPDDDAGLAPDEFLSDPDESFAEETT